MRGLRIFKNVILSGIKGLWKNKSMGMASIISIAALSIILGIVLITALSMNVILDDIQARVDEIEVYISDDVTEGEASKIKEMIQQRPGISDLKYKSKEDALNEMKKAWGEDSYMLEGLEKDNPLERSFLISVSSLEASTDIVNYAKTLKGVSNVIYYQDAINKLISITNYVRIGGLAIIVVLIIISILVISNTVKLTVIARRKEIEIMKYVGATNGMISGPFIIEGMIFGLLGAIVAYFVTIFAYKVFYKNYSEKIYDLVSSYLIEPNKLKIDLLIIFSTLGIVIGTVGSVFSLKKYLRA